MGSSDSANQRPRLVSILSMLLEGPVRMPGHKAGWGWEELAYLWGAGLAELELQITLDIASCSVCNQDQTGSGWGRRKSLSISVKPACACVSRLSGMTFVRAMVELSHHLIVSLIIHLPAWSLCAACFITKVITGILTSGTRLKTSKCLSKK